LFIRMTRHFLIAKVQKVYQKQLFKVSRHHEHHINTYTLE
jgi:hypothetical protein